MLAAFLGRTRQEEERMRRKGEVDKGEISVIGREKWRKRRTTFLLEAIEGSISRRYSIISDLSTCIEKQ